MNLQIFVTVFINSIQPILKAVWKNKETQGKFAKMVRPSKFQSGEQGLTVEELLVDGNCTVFQKLFQNLK